MLTTGLIKTRNEIILQTFCLYPERIEGPCHLAEIHCGPFLAFLVSNHPGEPAWLFLQSFDLQGGQYLIPSLVSTALLLRAFRFLVRLLCLRSPAAAHLCIEPNQGSFFFHRDERAFLDGLLDLGPCTAHSGGSGRVSGYVRGVGATYGPAQSVVRGLVVAVLSRELGRALDSVSASCSSGALDSVSERFVLSNFQQ